MGGQDMVMTDKRSRQKLFEGQVEKVRHKQITSDFQTMLQLRHEAGIDARPENGEESSGTATGSGAAFGTGAGVGHRRNSDNSVADSSDDSDAATWSAIQSRVEGLD